MHPEQIKAELRMAGTTPAMLADELAVTGVTVSNVIHGKCNSVRFEFKQGDNPYSDNTKSFGTVTEKSYPESYPSKQLHTE